MARALLQSFWAKGPLSPYEMLSMKSFIDYGNAYHLYTYDEGLETPEGVVRIDAREILPETELFTLQSGVGKGSLSIFSDRFRYELLLRRGGWWVDTDVICLSPRLPEDAVFFAAEIPGRVNCAVMKFPPNHEVMRRCRDATVQLGRDVRWGDTGPLLLTAALKEHGMLDQAADVATCYPIDWTETPLLFDPSATAALIERTRGSIMLHFWNEMLRRACIKKTVGVPPGSFLADMFARHAVAFPDRPTYDISEITALDEIRLRLQSPDCLDKQTSLSKREP